VSRPRRLDGGPRTPGSGHPGGLGPPIRTTTLFEGRIVNLRRSDYRRPDGTVVTREVMDHPGAVVMVPVEDDRVLLVRQPREAVEEMTLELPAGKLDHPGEDPLECARRELAEEVGRAAADWRDLGGFYTAPAILTEFIHCFLATGLSPVEAVGADEDEAIEVVEWPLADIESAIACVRDAKTLIGLLRLERELRAGGI
jgi:ADP-ribose pyrophosphatase